MSIGITLRHQRRTHIFRRTDVTDPRSTVCTSSGTTSRGGASPHGLPGLLSLRMRIKDSTVSFAQFMVLPMLRFGVTDPALVDKWFAVYDKHMRPMGSDVQTQTFSVPENVAVWNRPALATVEGRADLQEMQKGHKAKKRVSFLGQPSDDAENVHLGGYFSLPLNGRIDLMRPQPVPEVGKPDEEPLVEPLPSASASPPMIAQVLPTQLPERPPSPSAVWDARYSAPPQRSGSQYGEMRAANFNHYENAWDKPLGQHHENDWNPVNSYPVLPESVKQDQWYAGTFEIAPDRSKLKGVFPWETDSRPTPARRFPRGDTPPPAGGVPVLAVQDPTPPNQTPEQSHRDFFDAPKPQPQRNLSFADAMRSGAYRNAWDDVPAIKNYASRHGGRPSASSLEGPLNPGVKNHHTTESIHGLPDVANEGKRASKGKERDDHIDRRSETSRDGDDEETESSAEEEYNHSKRPVKLKQNSSVSGESAVRQPHSRQQSSSSVGTVGKRSYTERGAQTDRVEVKHQQVQVGSSATQGGQAPTSTLTSAGHPARPIYARDTQGYSSVTSDVTPVASRRASSETLISSPSVSVISPSGLAAIVTSTTAGESAGSIGKLHSIGESGQRDNGASTTGGTTPTTAPRRVGRVFDPSTDIDVSAGRLGPYASVLTLCLTDEAKRYSGCTGQRNEENGP